MLVLALSLRPIVGQQPAVPYRVTWFDAASVGAAGVLYLLPGALGLPNGGPSCAPCDPASLPGVDRWALRPVSATAATASNLADSAHDNTSVTALSYSSCGSGTEVGGYAVNGGGHAWPGGEPIGGVDEMGVTSRQFDTGEVIWSFLDRHHRTASNG